MVWPVEPVFEGSVVEGSVVESGAGMRLDALIDRVLAGVAVCVAGLVGWAATILRPAPDGFAVLALDCLALLAIALPGRWLVRQVRDRVEREIAGIYIDAFRRLEQPDRLAVRNPPTSGGLSGLAGLLGEMGVRVRRLRASRDRGAAPWPMPASHWPPAGPRRRN